LLGDGAPAIVSITVPASHRPRFVAAILRMCISETVSNKAIACLLHDPEKARLQV
jgi:hypothetical protein